MDEGKGTTTTRSPRSSAHVPRRAARLPRLRLRRSGVRAGASLEATPRGARAMARAVPLRYGRRVPRHQPRAARNGAAARRRAQEHHASSATTTSRSTPGAAPTCATSSISKATSRAPRWSSSSRTIVPRSRCSRRSPTRCSRTTRAPSGTRRCCVATRSGRTDREPGGDARTPTSRRASSPTRSSGSTPRDNSSKEIAILYRSNLQSEPIESALKERGIAVAHDRRHSSSTSARRSKTFSPISAWS